jgi:uncharacterized lipoprotein YbaY/heat shock protein HslJ
VRRLLQIIAVAYGFMTIAEAQPATVTGKATYFERIALPPGAVFVATLEDVSRADAKAILLGTHEKAPAGNPPYEFAISYDPAMIVPSGRYVVRARVLVDGKPRFISDVTVPVLTNGNGSEVTGMIRMVAVASESTMRGEFTYLADTASFKDCSTGKRYPVTMESGYLEVERAYMKLGKKGEPADLTVAGRIEKRPIGENGAMVDALVVQRLVRIAAGGGCPTLPRGYFKLTSIGEDAVPTKPGQSEPHIRLDPDTRRVSGNGGCNSMTGPYQVEGGTIRIGPLAATMMACADRGDTEASYFKALDQVRRWKLEGTQLHFLDDSGSVLLTFSSDSSR